MNKNKIKFCDKKSNLEERLCCKEKKIDKKLLNIKKELLNK